MDVARWLAIESHTRKARDQAWQGVCRAQRDVADGVLDAEVEYAAAVEFHEELEDAHRHAQRMMTVAQDRRRDLA